MNQKGEQTKERFHCYDCGGVWDIEGIDIYKTKDLTKYICKECRGRCLPDTELGKVKGVKSIRQKFGKGRITLVLLCIIFSVVVMQTYNLRIRVNDYNEYLKDTAALRTIINSRLKTYGDDYKILHKTGKNIKAGEAKMAQYRISVARKYISARDYEIENVQSPDTPEVIDLYNSEITFWKDPSYKNYVHYQGIYNTLKKRYGNDYFELLKDKVRENTQKTVVRKK